MGDLRISIIIPAYNEERQLTACLDSIAGQTIKPYEVLAVDNNSTDETASIARRYPFVRLLRESRQGVVFSRASGLDAATGDVLVRIDADTHLPPEWLKILQDFMERHLDAAAVTGLGVFYDAAYPKLTGRMQAFFYQYLQFPAMRGYTLWGSNMAVRRSAWQVVRGKCSLRSDIDEDIDLSIQLNKHGFKVLYSSALCAAVSLRRGRTSPIEVANYVSTWPRNYFVNRRPIAALYIAVLTLVVIICSSLAWLLTVLLPKR